MVSDAPTLIHISIHALREEGDAGARLYRAGGRSISIHALREEGDVFVFHSLRPMSLFLSTPSARRATSSVSTSSIIPANFYPRPPRGGRR